jgi:hypothetical protein
VSGASGVEVSSFRIGVSVTLYIRLFDDTVEADGRLRPTKGPSAQVPGEPVLTVTGERNSPDYRRTWRIPTPADGASLVARGDPTKLSGFELPPLPDPLTPTLPGDDPDDYPALIGGPADDHIVVANILARRVSLRLNSHRQADECELELPIDAIPFPPDGSVVRSILVEVRRGIISADDWADAMQAGRVAADGSPLTMPVATDSDEPDFAGFADLHALKAGSSGATTVRLTARDMAGVLADAQVRGRKISNDDPADEAISDFLSLLPAAVGLSVVWRGPGDPPTLGDAAPKARRTKKGKTIPRASDTKGSYLDAICDYCTLCGVVPTFRGYTLELAAPKTLDQFDVGDVNRMVYGTNVEEFELEHRLAGSSAKAIEVHSFDLDTGKLFVARFPPDPNRSGALPQGGSANDAAPTGPINIPPGASAVDEKSPTVMIVRGISDVKRLLDIAEAIFVESARQELTGRILTKDLSTVEGRGNGIADLLAMRAGDPISLVIAAPQEEVAGTYLQRLARLPRSEGVALLRRAGYPKGLAERIVGQIISTKRPLVYRVRSLTFTYAIEAATTTEIQVCNYIEAVDREIREGRPEHRSTNRRRVALAGGSFVEKWNAIEDDMQLGELSPKEAETLKRQVGDAERARRARDGGLDPTTAAGASAPTTSNPDGSASAPRTSAAFVGLGGAIGGL